MLEWEICWDSSVRPFQSAPEQHLDRDSKLQCHTSSLLGYETDCSAFPWLAWFWLVTRKREFRAFYWTVPGFRIAFRKFPVMCFFFLWKGHGIAFRLILTVHVHLCDDCTICKFRVLTWHLLWTVLWQHIEKTRKVFFFLKQPTKEETWRFKDSLNRGLS